MKNTAKTIKSTIILLLLAGVIFFLFPKMGIYTFFFDRGKYQPDTPPPSTVINDLDELTPKTKKLALIFLERCQTEGLDVVITETYRTQERQDYLYEQGRSREGQIVTWTKHSRHTDRYAFDICKNGPNPYGDEEFFKRCADIGREIGLTPGYDWEKCQDKPHYQYDTWWNH